ncbi:MAG: condensation domain-containing protein, partial [Candidatus Aminicenantes bacterium]|nr:condensation domain-containing protein [Candidatus Aminicenantes bacterium]
LQMASFSFDVFAEDLARTFLNGGKMVITPTLAVEPGILYELIKTHQVTIFESTPSYIIPFMQYIYDNRLTLDHLQLVIMGADVCPAGDFKELLARFGKQMRIVNSYGVTEATIDSSFYEEYNLENLPSHGSVPIGKPFPNVKFYILDAGGKPLPVGVPGELYIGGKGVARGYLYRMELTAEKFVFNNNRSYKSDRSYESNFFDKLYKTGDLARWLPDGNIEFSGRIDYQVKIRGYRIELGEIESRLLQHPDVREAVVLEKGEISGDKYLCAYFVSDKNLESTELREFLGRKLPEYMVPWFFIRLEKLPLSANGKIDRKALPEIQAVEKSEYAHPRDKTDEQIIEIWSRVLAVEKEKIGIDDNFFDLGGNSLKAIIIASYMHKQFAVRIRLVDIFQIQTVHGMADFIKESEQEEFAGLRPYEKRDYYALSSAQARLYILQQLELENTSYNIPLVLKIAGELDKNRFEETFKKLLDRHESLRTSFSIIANTPAQIIRNAAAVEFKIEYHELTRHDDEVGKTRIIKDFTRHFDLSQAPLLRAGIIEITSKEHILMVDMHHIMSDAFSHGILVHDFLIFYDRRELHPLKLQYKDFSGWQNSKTEQERIKRQAEYWLGEFQGKLPVLNLPTDFPRPAFQGFSGAVFCFEIEQGQAAALRALARQEGVTGHILLLAVFFILLAKLSDQDDIIVGTPIAGRSHADLENMIGVFINILAVRTNPQRQKTFLEFLREVRAKCLLSYENQDYPFEELVKQAALERDMSRSPLFDVIFEVQQRERQATGVKAAPEKQEPKLNFSYYPVENKTTKFDLDWVGVDAGETILFSINYCTDLFAEETIELMSQAYRVLLDEIIRSNECRIMDLEYCLPHDADTAGRPEVENKNIEFKF